MSAGIKSNSSGNLELYSGSTKILTANSTTGVATFTSNIIATAPTPTPSSNNTQLATTAYVDGKMVLGTSVNASGTSIDFTGIPSWVKRITIMLNGVSTNGSNSVIVQIGSGSFVTSNYVSAYSYTVHDGYNGYTESSGFGVASVSSNSTLHGHIMITNFSGKDYVLSATYGYSDHNGTGASGGSVTANGIIDRVRITTVNGSDTFDAGSINIMYEG
jgi:hypothetical protein